MWTRYFWVSLAERAIRTFFQTLVAVWPLADNTLGLWDVDWAKSASVAGMAAVVSVAMSLGAAKIGPDGSPSLVGEPPKQPETVLTADPDEVVPSVDNPVDEPAGRHVLDDDPHDLPVSHFENPRPARPTHIQE